MNAKDIVYKRFIAPLENKIKGNIGVELEFPLINLDKQPVDEGFAKGYLKHLVENGFKTEDCDTSGEPAFVVNSFGDCISFDNSYNNIEFSMNYGDNLLDLSKRFYSMYKEAAEYFSQRNYIIAGIGSNLYKKYIKSAHVSYPVYNMVESFLYKHNGSRTHGYPDFPGYLSSVQTHLDVDFKDVPYVADLLSKMDFAAAYIFANSLSFDDTDYLCFRDYLWEKSAFGLLADNTGSVDTPYNNIEGLLKSYLSRSVFNRIRNGSYEIFEPVLVEEYFERDDAMESDIQQFLSFRNIEVTARGTVEVRSTCAQPIKDAFAPPAFYLGVAHNFEKARVVVDEFFDRFDIKEKNSVLRHLAVKGEMPDGVTKDDLSKLLISLIDIARDGLMIRGKSEETLLQPLYERAEKLVCPALEMKKRLKNGEFLDTIIKEFSKI